MILSLPEHGFQVSKTKHNVDRSIVCDWVEASVLFSNDPVSMNDVVDVLQEENVYSDQDFATELVEETWANIERRQRWLGDSRVVMIADGTDRFVATRAWQESPAHSFCLAVSLRDLYSKWSESAGDYIAQGALFEQITAAALQQLGWEAERTGWSGRDGNLSSDDLIARIAERVNESPTGNSAPADTKDVGLDLVCFKPFGDFRGGYPVYLVQCASGANWRRKLRSPALTTWQHLISFSALPQRGIAVAQAFPTDDRFREHRISAEGIFWDRYRLLAAGSKRIDWLPVKLTGEVISWLGPRIATLPYSQ